MKYIVVLGDGMSDRPIEELDGKTPLEAAATPMIDRLAEKSEVGLARTVPEGMTPGSDIANLSVFGFDPRKYYTGRSPLEAASIGVELSSSDVCYRANLVTLSDGDGFSGKTMVDYSAGEVSPEEAAALIGFLRPHFPEISLYAGVSYRNCLVLRDSETGAELTAPHDISGKEIFGNLPKGQNSELLFRIMKKSNDLLSCHPINVARERAGKNAANCLWLWGEGKRPALPNFRQTFGKSGAVISAVDLLKGIAICAGLDSIDVPGANGTVNTNWDGKAAAAIDALKTHDFLFVHLEAPDEASHQGKLSDKIRSIELIDERIVTPIIGALTASDEDFAMLILPDHATPIEIMTHSGEPVPYLLFNSKKIVDGPFTFSESTATETGNYVGDGCELIKKLFNF